MCMVDGLDDRASVWNESSQKARKPHKCEECNRVIEVGEVYCRVWAISGDGPFTAKWCAHCDVAKDWLWENCGGSVISAVQEDIQEHISDYRGDAICVPRLKRLDVGMSRKWRVARGPRKGHLMPIPRLPAKLEPKHAH